MPKFAVLIPLGSLPLVADPRLKALESQTCSDWTGYVIGADDQITLPVNYQTLPGDGTKFSGMINAAVATGAEYIVPLAEHIILRPEALAILDREFQKRPDAGLLYSDFTEPQANGICHIVRLFNHEGAPHERFDFGYLKVWRSAAVKAIGGLREDLAHAAEYDAELKLAEKGTLEVVSEVLYDVDPASLAAKGDSKPSALHSPGKGKLGGFSYIFYPEDMEREITAVFEDALKRRGAWIDHPTVAVPQPKHPYTVLASVIIPVFNRVKYIGNAIERVLEGTFQDFEIVVIDNGSTDGTQAEVLKYVAKDKRVRLLAQQGPSISYALNSGIRAAKGKYICQLDSDDEYTPDCLELMIGHLESHPKCGLAISYYELMDDNRNPIPEITPITHSGYSRNQILRRDGAGALRVFPKAVLEENGFYDEENFGNFGEDYDMVLKTGEKYDVDRVHKVLYRYRRHEDNTDVTRDPLMKVRNKNNARLNAIGRRRAINQSLGKA
jgi:GT2 family glycosyltransferase